VNFYPVKWLENSNYTVNSHAIKLFRKFNNPTKKYVNNVFPRIISKYKRAIEAVIKIHLFHSILYNLSVYYVQPKIFVNFWMNSLCPVRMKNYVFVVSILNILSLFCNGYSKRLTNINFFKDLQAAVLIMFPSSLVLKNTIVDIRLC